MRRFVVACVLTIGLTAPPPGRAAEKPSPSGDSKPATFEEREKAYPQNTPRDAESLALPRAGYAAQMPPGKVAAGQLAVPQMPGQQHRVIWQIVPWQEVHAEFLTRCPAAKTDAERLELGRWCLAQKLPACAGFLFREVIRAHWNDIGHSTYVKALRPWRKLAERRPSPHTVDLPVRGVWHVAKDMTGHHQWKHHALFAFDLTIQRDGKRYRGDNRKNLAAYYAWGQPFYAVADGIVKSVENDHPDVAPGVLGRYEQANSIMIDHGGGVFAHYAHHQKGSARVRPGDRVWRGQELALVGNSGRSGVPHLHFSLSDADYFSIPGRYRYEELRGTAWVERDGVDLRPGIYVRPAAGVPQRPADTSVLPW